MEKKIMQQNQPTPQKTVIALIATISFFFIIIIAIAIVNPLINKPIINSLNTNSDSVVGQFNLKPVEEELRATLKQFYNLDPDTINNVQAIIREDTIEYNLNDQGELISTSFLIDLDNPKLTYQVRDGITSNFISFTCPSIELAQDPNVFCIGYNGQSTIDATIGRFLPYQGKTPSGIDFSIWHDFDDNNNPRLDMFANICNDEAIGKEVESSIKYWLIQHNIPNPDIIPLNLDYSHCSHSE